MDKGHEMVFLPSSIKINKTKLYSGNLPTFCPETGLLAVEARSG